MQGPGFSVRRYHHILCKDAPDFLHDYALLPAMRRLAGVGLLCGTDWTPLFKNQFFYSRLDHSVGTALIVWNFTHDKRQSLAALFHDISAPAFSHVMDFKNGDALTQQSTEMLTSEFLNDDAELVQRLSNDGIYMHEVDDYHKYPVADNDIPGLSADRLEYMYPSGAALAGIWSIDDVERNYGQIALLKNERGLPELGFLSAEAAAEYARKFCEVSMILQRNEDKVSMQLLADVVSLALDSGIIEEADLYTKSERNLIETFDAVLASSENHGSAGGDFKRHYRTFRGMRRIVRSGKPLPGAYNVSLAVKRRYVDPLVSCGRDDARRISSLDSSTAECIGSFLRYNDSLYGAVPWL